MPSYFTFLYVFIFTSSLISKNWKLAVAVCIIFITHLIILPIYRGYKKNKVKNLIAKTLSSDNIQTEPFININMAPAYILEELPDFLPVQAKKIIWIKRHNGNYTSIEDFFNKLEIGQEQQQILKKLIFC